MTPEDPGAVDTAWRIHAAIADWTGKVDSKASFTLAIESAVLGAIVTLTGSNRRLAGMTDWTVLLPFSVGMLLLALAVLHVIFVVKPSLRRSKVEKESRDNFVFFGHLRHWKAPDLELALRERAVLPVLSRQLVNMSDIAWSKHSRLSRSMWFAMIGTALVGLAAGLNG